MTAPDHDGRTTWKLLLSAVEDRRNLSAAEAAWAMGEMMSGRAEPLQVAGLLVGLRTKGETAEELRGMADTMLELAVDYRGEAGEVDIVGTGGDQLNTVNISTMASLVLAGAGLRVVKHGNRASTSATGSADVLERLGLPLDADPERVEASVGAVGITFLFANAYHPAMKRVAPIRRALQVPTVFNYLGPLANPASVPSTVIGVSNPEVAPLMAEVVAARGHHGLVFTGPGGIDELTLFGPTRAWEAHEGQVQEQMLLPGDFDLEPNRLEDIQGRDAVFNAQVVNRVLAGESGPIRDTVVLNAAAGLAMARPGSGSSLSERINAFIPEAERALDSGAAQQVLRRWTTFLRGES